MNMVCNGSGGCIGCTVNGSCGSICKPGTYSCNTGAPVCNSSNASAGTACGSSLACDGNGNCLATVGNGLSCQANGQCQSGNCSKNGTAGLCCATGYSNCGTCVNEQTDSNNCGSCNNKCGANRTCQTGGCVCVGYSLTCGGCGSWSFESGTAENWVVGSEPFADPTLNASQSASASTAIVHDGSYSLAVPMTIDFNPKNYASVAVPLCPSGSVNLNGYTMSAWIYFAGPPMTYVQYATLGFWAWGPSVSDTTDFLVKPMLVNTDLPVGQWLNYFGTFQSSVLADHIGILLTPGAGWTGTMYVDSVSLTHP
jgi:hypothetical protein